MKNLDVRKTRATTMITTDTVVDENFVLDDQQINLQDRFPILQVGWRVWIIFAIRLFLCTVGIIGLKYIEKRNINQLNFERNHLQHELDDLNVKKKNLETTIKQSQVSTAQSEELHNKLSIIEKLVKRRQQAFIGLDYIQSVVSDTIWLEKVNFEKQSFKIEGIGLNTDDVEYFVEELEKTLAFAKVNLENITENKQNSDGQIVTRKHFVIVSILK